MHYFVAVLVPNNEEDVNIEGEVASLLEDHGDGQKWDWYQIGGRWTGAYDGYNPAKDPKNWEKCDLCKGTGERKDLNPEDRRKGYCNGCSSSKEDGCPAGMRVKWPTEWKIHKGDIAPAKDALKKKATPHSVVTPDGEWHEAEVDWDNYEKPTRAAWKKKTEAAEKKWFEKTVPTLFKKHKDCVAVVVDCHN